MHPEIKHQLYGGDISDYYGRPKTDSIEKENKDLADIYMGIKKKNNPLNLPPNKIDGVNFFKST
jgi:hypothetical protein